MACKELQPALLDELKVACGAFSEHTWEGCGDAGYAPRAKSVVFARE
jgi:hypothetical protein